MDECHNGIKVSIIILCYNSIEDIRECIPSILNQSFKNYEIIIVDNNSTDNTAEFIKKSYPDIKIIETGQNLGYALGNNVGVKEAIGEYIVILNPDTKVDPMWLSTLLRPLEEDSTIGLTTSKIIEYYDRDHGACGNSPHYTGLHFPRGLEKPITSFTKPEVIGAISGCSFAMRRDLFESLGGFDPEFFLYLEDSDLSIRTRYAGYKIMFEPESVVYHKHKISITPQKEFYLERNRYQLLLKNYSGRMLICFLPAFFVTEIITWGHAIINGHRFVHSKLHAYWYIIKNLNRIHDERIRVSLHKRVSDREIVKLLDWKIPFEQMIHNRAICYVANIVFNTFFKIYFDIVKYFI